MKYKLIFLFICFFICFSNQAYGAKKISPMQWVTFKATFYNQSCKTCIYTKSGRKVEHGKTLSVDPKLIPLGSIVQIKYPNGKSEIRRADDTGRLIKGKKVDVFYDYSRKTLLKMGVQKIQLRILYLSHQKKKGQT